MAAWVVFGLVMLVILAGLLWTNRATVNGWFEGAPPAEGNPLLPASEAEVARAEQLLADLQVVAAHDWASDYRRDAFGPTWADTDANGCNQRDDVLHRDVLRTEPFTAARQWSCDHDMVAGTWRDAYTGELITLSDAKAPDQAQSLQIDHLVALSVAWRDGADAWDDTQRLAFANDLRNLAPVAAATNKAKGGSDAAGWRPVRQAECGFAVRYITVKSDYSLVVDRAEKRALVDMLATCR